MLGTALPKDLAVPWADPCTNLTLTFNNRQIDCQLWLVLEAGGLTVNSTFVTEMVQFSLRNKFKRSRSYKNNVVCGRLQGVSITYNKGENTNMAIIKLLI